MMKNKYLLMCALLVSGLPGLQCMAGDETSVSDVQAAYASLATAQGSDPAAPDSSDISFAAVAQLVEESGREAAAYISLAVQQLKSKIVSGWSWLTSKVSSSSSMDPTTGDVDDVLNGETADSNAADDSGGDQSDDSSGESAGTEQE